MTQDELLDFLERAHEYGCFPEVLKLIRQGSEKVLIEVILEKAKERMEKFPFDWDNFFGAD